MFGHEWTLHNSQNSENQEFEIFQVAYFNPNATTSLLLFKKANKMHFLKAKPKHPFGPGFFNLAPEKPPPHLLNETSLKLKFKFESEVP